MAVGHLQTPPLMAVTVGTTTVAAATAVVVAMEDVHHSTTAPPATAPPVNCVARRAKRFDASFTGPPENRSASAASTSYGIDTNWYTDTGATDHITSELGKLIVMDKYHGTDQVHTSSDAGMRINQIGQSFVHTPKRDLVVNNVLYVPEASKNHLTSDNHAFVEFHPNYFLAKDLAMKKILLRETAKVVFIP